MNKNELKKILQGQVVFVGIGNPLRGDDGWGPVLIASLRGKIGMACFDAGTAPENFTGKVVQNNPDTIIFLDAVDLNLAAGEWAILDKTEILKTGFTTHDLSPALLIQYLETQTQAKVYLLGVQPQNLGLGDQMSEPVSKTLAELSRMIPEVLNA